MDIRLRYSITLIICYSLLVFSLSVFAEPSRYEQWQQNRPFTLGAMYYDGAYGPAAQLPAPENAQPDMALFRYAGLNLLDEVSWSNGGHDRYPGASAAQEAGFSYFILGAAWQEDAEASMNAFQSHVMFMTEDPRWSGLCGVQLADEPRNPVLQANYRRQRDWLVQTYPHLLTLICETFSDYPTWEKQYEVIQPDALIFQWYPYWTSDAQAVDISPYMYACLTRASKFCQGNGVGFFIARGVCGEARSESLLRLTTFASLAYGCKGFVDFAWDSSDKYKQPQLAADRPDSGYVHYQKGKPRVTPQLEKMARINREVANIAPTLLGLRHIRTYHLNLESKSYGAELEYNIADMEKDGLLSNRLTGADSTTKHVLIGFLKDAQDSEYFMVVNKRNARDGNGHETQLLEKITLTFADEVETIQRISRHTGQVDNISLKDHTYEFYLPGGTGELFTFGATTAAPSPESGE